MAAILALLSFGCLVLAGYGLSAWIQQRLVARREVVTRLRGATGIQMGGGNEAGSLLKDQRLSGIPAFDALLARMPLIAPLVAMIQQAGLRRRAGEVLLYIPLLALIGYLVCALLGFKLPIRLAVCGVLGLIPIAIIRRMRSKRLYQFSEQLPDALDWCARRSRPVTDSWRRSTWSPRRTPIRSAASSVTSPRRSSSASPSVTRCTTSRHGWATRTCRSSWWASSRRRTSAATWPR
jgi:hypothetical protein